MKKSTIISIAALLTGSLLLGGCGKSAQEEYLELCKKYEPYYAHKIVSKYYTPDTKVIWNTDKEHSILDNLKNGILDGEKIFNQMEKLAASNAEINKHFQSTYLWSNDTPKEAKRRFNNALEEHHRYHSKCTYNFKF